VIVPRLFEGPLSAVSPRALMVGQYPLVLAALGRLLSGPPLNMTVELSTRSDEAIQRVTDEGHELLFCDLRSPPMTGVELATRLTRSSSPTRVVLLADEEDASLLVAALDCGAAGFFTREASANEFVDLRWRGRRWAGWPVINRPAVGCTSGFPWPNAASSRWLARLNRRGRSQPLVASVRRRFETTWAVSIASWKCEIVPKRSSGRFVWDASPRPWDLSPYRHRPVVARLGL